MGKSQCPHDINHCLNALWCGFAFSEQITSTFCKSLIVYIYNAQSCNAPFALQARHSLSWMLNDITVQDGGCSAPYHDEIF